MMLKNRIFCLKNRLFGTENRFFFCFLAFPKIWHKNRKFGLKTRFLRDILRTGNPVFLLPKKPVSSENRFHQNSLSVPSLLSPLGPKNGVEARVRARARPRESEEGEPCRVSSLESMASLGLLSLGNVRKT